MRKEDNDTNDSETAVKCKQLHDREDTEECSAL